MHFPSILVKKKWIFEFRRTNHQELKCWSTFCVNYFLRYYLLMQHQPIVKRVNETHEWAHRPYQLLITAACTNTGSKIKGNHSRAADRCPFVPRRSLSQVTSFMQLGMLWISAWIRNRMSNKVLDEITYPFPNSIWLLHWRLGMDK